MSNKHNMRVINLDFVGVLPGGMPSEHDNAMVVSLDQEDLHPITGVRMPKWLHTGTIKSAYEYVRAHNGVTTP